MKKQTILISIMITLIQLFNLEAQTCSWPPPVNLTVNEIGENAADISWSAPTSGTPPGGYKIILKNDETSDIVQEVSTFATSYQYNGLESGKAYTASVHSVCENGGIGTHGPETPIVIYSFIIGKKLINNVCGTFPTATTSPSPNAGGIPDSGLSNNSTFISVNWPNLPNGHNTQVFLWKSGITMP